MLQIAVAILFQRVQQLLLFNPTLMAACTQQQSLSRKYQYSTYSRCQIDAAQTLGTLWTRTCTAGDPITNNPVTELVNIVRSAAPPLTLSPDRLIGGNAPFTVTLTSTTAITLTSADIKVDGWIYYWSLI